MSPVFWARVRQMLTHCSLRSYEILNMSRLHIIHTLMSFRTEQRSIIPSINLAMLANVRISARIPHTVKHGRDPTTATTHDRSFPVNSRESNHNIVTPVTMFVF